MYRIKLNGIKDKYDFNELIKIFLRPDQYEVLTEDDPENGENHEKAELIEINENRSTDKNAVKREIYRKLSLITGKRPPWGILTGVRPVKLAGEIVRASAGDENAPAILQEEYLLSEEKSNLLTDIYGYQQRVLDRASDKSTGVYIGIPFCPTRCLYCSFTSNQKGPEDIESYLSALFKEIEYCGQGMKDSGVWAETIYIGGGTPTTLTAQQLNRLLEKISQCFDLYRVTEFTVEAGRPDTISEEKLDVIKNHGIRRISINPQTMKDETLKLIGREHSAVEIREAFEMRRFHH